MASFGTTAKWALRYLLGASNVNEIDDGFAALASDIDSKLTPYDEGLLAARPVSTLGTPGIRGRFYRATDDTSGGPSGTLYLDYGTGWIAYASYDADLAAIAALTTTAFGLSLLTQASAAAARATLGAAGTNVQAFTANGRWTKPSGCTYVEVVVIGGGGGGGGGGSTDGGAGGGGGGVLQTQMRSSDLGATVAITVGGGGGAGAANSVGSAGGASTFGNLIAAGGAGGAAGSGTVSIAPAGQNGGPGGSGSIGGAGGTGGSALTGGGGGGGAKGTNIAGGVGGSGMGAAGAASTAGGSSGSAGGGGGGGGGTVASVAAVGGSGGNYGGGGGGGAGATSPKAGGAGAAGFVLVIAS